MSNGKRAVTEDCPVYVACPGESRRAKFTNIRTARGATDMLSELYVGQDIVAYRDDGEIAWITHMKYAKDDPIWSAEPDHESSLMLYSAAIKQAMYDATLGNISGKVSTHIDTFKERAAANWFITHSSRFERMCRLVDIDPDDIRSAVDMYKIEVDSEQMLDMLDVNGE
jgi:hypothetical protein